MEMARESERDVDIAEKSDSPDVEEKSKEVSGKKKEKSKGLISRVWNALFRSRNEDLERRLERLSKEEAVVLLRTRKRSIRGGRIKRNILIFSFLFEVIAIVYALMTARSVENWKKRAFHVLPMFLLPALSSITYISIVNFMKMGERKDQKTLERLRTERQSKIDELKEKTNYYITQQLIQRYDTDPAAKAAAASVLASKLGAESGLKVYIEDELKHHATTGKGNDVDLVQPDGLRNRKHPQDRSRTVGSSPVTSDPGSLLLQQMEAENAALNQLAYVDHYQQAQGSNSYSSGWLARLVAVLVGEDPTQCFALICGNCHMHNGLASKEDFPFVTYICPHCRVMNGPRKKDDRVSNSSSPVNLSSSTVDNAEVVDRSSREETPDSSGNEQQTPPSPVTEIASDEAVTSKDKES